MLSEISRFTVLIAKTGAYFSKGFVIFQAKTASIITVEITPPSEPNGKISRYRVVVNGEVVSL
jgi:hypothetical protein